KLESVGQQRLMDYGGRFFDFILPYNPDKFMLTTKKSIRYTLHEQHGLTHVEDVFGNTLQITDDKIISSLGLSIPYERNAAGHITSITKPNDPDDGLPAITLGYAYDAAGNLIRFTDGEGRVTTYAYANVDRPHLLTNIVDASGQPVIRTVYDD